MYEEKIGIVYKFFKDNNIALIKLNSKLSIGDIIHIRNDKHNIDFEQIVKKIERNHKEVEFAIKGDEIGVKVNSIVKKQDVVLRIIE